MRSHWDWMEAVMPVAYVPTLGPVRQGDPLSQLFEAVVDIAGTGRFLPYDKDRRWSVTKTERVLVDSVEHDQRQTRVPTLVEVPVEAGRTVRGGEPKPAAVDAPPDVPLPCGEPDRRGRDRLGVGGAPACTASPLSPRGPITTRGGGPGDFGEGASQPAGGRWPSG